MTAESRKATKTKQGFERWEWVKDPNQRNEGLDTMLQAEAAFIRIAGPSRELLDAVWKRYFDEREAAPLAVQLDLEDVIAAPHGRAANSEKPATVVRPRRTQRKMRLN